MRTFRLPRALLAALLALAMLPAHAQDAAKPEAKPDAAPADAAKSEPAKPEPGPGQDPDPEILRGLLQCLAVGLPENWQRAWFEIHEIRRDATGRDRQFQALFHYATSEKDHKGQKLQPCGADEILEGVGKLNAYLPSDQLRWTGATFTFLRDGRFDAKYDYTPPKPAAKAPAKPAAKKKTDAKK